MSETTTKVLGTQSASKVLDLLKVEHTLNTRWEQKLIRGH